MKDLRGISATWFKNQLCPSIRLSRLRTLKMREIDRETRDIKEEKYKCENTTV
jgi:hypothetical protein